MIDKHAKQYLDEYFAEFNATTDALASLRRIVSLKGDNSDEIIEEICFNNLVIKKLDFLMIKCSAKRLVCQAYAIAIEMQKRRRGRKIFKTEALERIFDEADAQIAKMVGELLFLSISNSEDRNSFIISVIEFLVNFAVYFFFMSFSN